MIIFYWYNIISTIFITAAILDFCVFKVAHVQIVTFISNCYITMGIVGISLVSFTNRILFYTHSIIYIYIFFFYFFNISNSTYFIFILFHVYFFYIINMLLIFAFFYTDQIIYSIDNLVKHI